MGGVGVCVCMWGCGDVWGVCVCVGCVCVGCVCVCVFNIKRSLLAPTDLKDVMPVELYLREKCYKTERSKVPMKVFIF